MCARLIITSRKTRRFLSSSKKVHEHMRKFRGKFFHVFYYNLWSVLFLQSQVTTREKFSSMNHRLDYDKVENVQRGKKAELIVMVWVYVKHEVTLKGLKDEENGTLEMKVLFL